jgi:hypothetical protein
MAVFDEVCYPRIYEHVVDARILQFTPSPLPTPQKRMLEVIMFSKYGIRKRQYNLQNLTRQVLKFCIRTSHLIWDSVAVKGAYKQ